MINESLVVSFVMTIFQSIQKDYKESYIGRFVTWVSSGIVSWLMGSYILGFFRSFKGNQLIEESLLLNRSSKTKSNKLIECFNQWCEQSLILSFYERMDGFFLVVLLMVLSMAFIPTKLSMILGIALVGLYGYNILRGNEVIRNRSTSYLLLGMMCVVIIENIFTAFNRQNTIMIALIFLAYYASIIIIGKCTTTDRRLSFIMNTILFIMILCCLYGLYQYVIGVEVDKAWVDEEMFGTATTRIYSVFGNPNVFGIFLVITVPLAFGMFVAERHWFMKLVYLGTTGLGLLSIALTMSRGSLLGVVLAIGIMLLFMDQRFLFLGLAGVVAMPFVLPQSYLDRIYSIGNLQESSSAYRLSIYQASIDMIKDFFWGGLGLGGFNEVYFAYAYSASKAYHAHNTFLMVLIEMGILGFVVFISLLILWIKELMSAYFVSNNKKYKMIILACLGGIAGSSFQGLVEHIWHNYDVMFFYWLIIVVGTAVAAMARREVIKS